MNTTDIGEVLNTTPTRDLCAEWWCDQTDVLLTLEIFTILMCVLGSFGNLVTSLAVMFSSLRYSVNCILIGSQSFAGFLYCSLILSMQAALFHRQSHIIEDSVCSAAGGIRYTLVGVIMVHLAAIALYRFMNVVNTNKYRYMCQDRQLIITLVICWTLPMLFTIPPSLKWWGAFTFQSKILACTFDTAAKQSNRLAMVTAGFIFPCILIVYCYSRIGCVAYSSFKRMGELGSTKAQTKSIKLSGMMLCIFLLFFLGTFPYFVVNVSDNTYKYPVNHIWTTMVGWLSYCLNPVGYTLMDSRFRIAYKRVLTGQCEKNPTRRQGSSISRTTSVL